jgi:hypothetical protein
MKAQKVLFTVLFLSMFFLISGISKADGGSGNKASELNTQIIQEVREVLKNPYLKFQSKDLNGYVNVITAVEKDGRITFKKIEGINEDLVENTIAKLNSLNLWTGKDYSGKEFTYKIKYSN